MKFLKGLPREVKGLSFVTFFVSVGFGVQAPVLPIFADQLGAGTTAVGAMIAAFAIVRIVSAWPLGRLTSRMGERATLVIGMALLAVTSVFMGFAQNTWQLIVFRGLGGLGSAAFSIAALSLLLRKSPPDSRGRSIGLFMGALNMGLVAGPAIGGAMVTLPPEIVFYIYGGVVALTGFLAMAVMDKDEGHHQAATTGGIGTLSIMAAMRSSVFRAAIVMNFSLGWIVYGMRSSVLPLMLLNDLHEPKIWVGAGLALCALLQVAVLPASGRLTDVLGRKRPLIAGALALAGGLALLTALPNLTTYLLCMSFLGVGAALGTTASSAAIGDVTRGQGGTVVAIYQMGSDLGMVIGPLAAGALAEKSYPLALSLSAAVAVWGMVMAIVMPRTKSAVSAPPQPIDPNIG